MRTALLVACLMTCVACGSNGSSSDAPAADSGDEADLVGGTPDKRWAASGYLAHAASFEAIDGSQVSCGGTLIAPRVVVTAAHCVLAAKGDAWGFGTGDGGAGALVKVSSVHPHPDFHEQPQGSVDVTYFLKNYDVAYLILEKDVAGVTPALLADDSPEMGCGFRAIGYHRKGAVAQRRSTTACVEFDLTLGHDPIFEVHPADLSALCHGDGDEGSAIVSGDDKAPVLHGVYVGSVTQGLTDCVRGTQFLDGYESAYGYRDFLQAGIDAAAASH